MNANAQIDAGVVAVEPEDRVTMMLELELRYVTLQDLVEQTITIPVHVNVGLGDHAAGRIPNPTVRTELVHQQTQVAKSRAADVLRTGDSAAALRAYDTAAAHIDAHSAKCPSPELSKEREIISELRTRTDSGEGAWAAKFTSADQCHKNRTRGRRHPRM